MSENQKTLKSLDNFKFDSVGDEFLYLYETLYDKNLGELPEDENNTPNIDEMREEYNCLLNEQEIQDRYPQKSIYWSEGQERAIAKYIREKDFEKRNVIFRENLYQPFKKLIENIIFTYKLFRNDIDINELQIDCMSFLMTKIDRFNPTNGTKAFAYFGTIAKHYLMGEKKTVYKVGKLNVDITDNTDEVGSKNFYTIDGDIEKPQTTKIFQEIISTLEFEIQKPKMLTNDRKVGEAIIYIFRNHELLDVYNKNVVYHLLKERTGLQTKEITYSLSRFKSFYRIFKEGFLKNYI